MDFKVNEIEVGTQNSEVHLREPAVVKVSAKVAAFLNETIDPNIHPLNIRENVWIQKPFWNIERGRISDTRTIAVELVVNGEVVAKDTILADGSIQDLVFETKIERSSWVALRILPSSHTNPVFVLVNNQPIRTNRKSAEWCRDAVEVCWKQKQGLISNAEKATAQQAYEAAKKVYQKIIDESK